MSARQVRRFQLERDVDVSGVSGTGAVAFGAQAPDGTCVLWWASGLESTAIYPNMETLLAIHGHGGKTRAIYIDPETFDGVPAGGGDGGGGAAGRPSGGPAQPSDEHDDAGVSGQEPLESGEAAHALARAGASRIAARAGAHTAAARRAVRPPTRSS